MSSSYLSCRFRWVYCQVVHLRDRHPGCMRHTLAEITESLDETYESIILRGIKKENTELTHCIFQDVAVAVRRLHVNELAEILAFDFNAGPIPKFHEDWRLEDPLEAVSSTCSPLISLDNSLVTTFSQFSVKEFLISARFVEKCDTISRRCHISDTRSCPRHASMSGYVTAPG